MEELGLTTLLERRIRRGLIETIKIINGISIYGWQCFYISPQLKIYNQSKFQRLSQFKKLFFFAYRAIYFWTNHQIILKTAIMYIFCAKIYFLF